MSSKSLNVLTNILHIAKLNNDICNGVCVAVPQHIMAQQQIKNLAVVNLTNIQLEGVYNQFEYKKPFLVSSLPAPFSKPDLVVFHEIYKFDYIDISKQLRNKGIPYIIIPHGSLTKEAQRKKWLKKLTANLIFFNSFIKRATAIQFLSENEKELSPFGKIKFIGTNGVDIPRTRKEIFNADGVSFLYIGNLFWRIKGLDLMLSAIGACANELRENRATVKLFGPFDQNKELHLRKLIEVNGVADFVVLNDAITGVQKRKKILDCDIFIQTSRSEGMPMGILEALSYGIPCLVTEGTNLGELIKKYDAGWVAKTEVESISATIEQAIHERHLWIEKSKNARRLIEDHFMWDNIEKNTLKHYQFIVTNHSGVKL